MSIARTIVTNHEGDIWVESAEGAGTIVTVTIALARAGVPPARTDRAGGGLPA
jgi:signal transduction histidine kinase